MRNWFRRREAKQATQNPERAESPPGSNLVGDDLRWFIERYRYWQQQRAANPPLSAEQLDALAAARDLRSTRAEWDYIAQQMVMTGGWYMPPAGASGVTAEAVDQVLVQLRGSDATFAAQREQADWQVHARARQDPIWWANARIPENGEGE